MKSKKVLKIASAILLMIILICISINSFADDGLDFNPKDVVPNGNVKGSEQIKTVGSTVVGILQTVGIVLSVVVLIVLGIKYMMGSAEEKAEYKKSMMPYVIGAVLIFAASALAQVVFNFFTGINVT